MKRSLAQFALLITCAIGLVAAPTASAAHVPPFTAQAIHGKFAYGHDPKTGGPARFNLRTGAERVYALPTAATAFETAAASNTALVGVATNPRNAYASQWLYRYDLKSGRNELLATLPNGAAGLCAGEFRPISIADDGTVVALTRIANFGEASGCVRDPAPTKLWRYRPGAPPEEVWLPEKFRTQLDTSRIAANGNTIALATAPTTITPTQLVMVDTVKHVILAQRQAEEVGGLWLFNPHSLFVGEEAGNPLGRISRSNFRVRDDEKTVFAGLYNAANSTNCGSRMVVLGQYTLRLISSRGKVLLKRRVRESTENEYVFSAIACSTDYLQYVEFDVSDGAPIGLYGSVKHIVNISKLR